MIRTRVGYAGGKAKKPTYDDLLDHTEAIEIVYDPTVVTYGALLDVFWKSHMPTREPWNRQYRSAIFPHDEEQRVMAEMSRTARERALGKKLHTAIEDMSGTGFWQAEDYHQKYRLRGNRAIMAEFTKMYPNSQGFIDSTAAARVNGFLAGHGSGAHLEDLGLSEPSQALLKQKLTH